jgi:hypothetical protein
VNRHLFSHAVLKFADGCFSLAPCTLLLVIIQQIQIIGFAFYTSNTSHQRFIALHFGIQGFLSLCRLICPGFEYSQI